MVIIKEIDIINSNQIKTEIENMRKYSFYKLKEFVTNDVVVRIEYDKETDLFNASMAPACGYGKNSNGHRYPKFINEEARIANGLTDREVMLILNVVDVLESVPKKEEQ